MPRTVKGVSRPEVEVRKMVVSRLESGWGRLMYKHQQEMVAHQKKLEAAKKALEKAEKEASK